MTTKIIQLQQGNVEIVWPFLETLPFYAYNILPPRIINTVTILLLNW
ncbi:483_t:CDS:2 [Cetraspora pellucida]|uniref:483_t:CDS:1 n=1 Tax=Cetraspora pellucida TaxID=1433469 RepID=A0ACA9KN36_9GLOM|nr:483_t:CDS:2 [Cetraspora pellucida]